MRQWVDADRLLLVVERDDGTMTVALRPEVDAVWGPPIRLGLDATVEQWARHWEANP